MILFHLLIFIDLIVTDSLEKNKNDVKQKKKKDHP